VTASLRSARNSRSVLYRETSTFARGKQSPPAYDLIDRDRKRHCDKKSVYGWLPLICVRGIVAGTHPVNRHGYKHLVADLERPDAFANLDNLTEIQRMTIL